MDLGDVARELSAARRGGAELPPPSDRDPAFSIDDGYAVGRLLHDGTLALGRSQVGVKLGFTNQGVWRQMGLDAPFWSPMYEDTVLYQGEVSLEGLVAPRIEPEIVLGFGSPLPPGASMAEICNAIEWAALGFEIVQCHYPSWKFKPADAIADAGLHGRLVVGDRVALSPRDPPDLADVGVELFRGDAVVEKGRGSNALGGPAEAVRWLLGLPGVEGLRSADVVTTGTLTGAPSIAPGETWHVSAAGPVPLGRLQVHFPPDR